MPQTHSHRSDPDQTLNPLPWMRQSQLLSTWGIFASLALATGACTQKSKESNKSTQPPEQATQIQNTNAPEWSLSWLSRCQDAETGCIGQYGFDVRADGTWQVGPAATGQVYRGELTIDERKSLTSLLDSMRTSEVNLNSNSLTCANEELASSWINDGALDSAKISIQFFGKSTELNLNATGFCSVISTESTQSLSDLLTTIVTRYHPSVFPDECLNQALEVESAYESLRSCEKDQDCAWLDSTFHPITETELQFVMTDSCTKLRPLAAANAARMTESVIESLQTARAQLVEACGTSIARVDCEGITGFESSAIRPVCDLGKCKLPSSEASVLRFNARHR